MFYVALNSSNYYYYSSVIAGEYFIGIKKIAGSRRLNRNVLPSGFHSRRLNAIKFSKLRGARRDLRIARQFARIKRARA